MSTLAQRLQQALADVGRRPADLARACKVRPPSVADWLSGKTKQLKALPLLRAAEFLNVRPEWLQTGAPPMRPGHGAHTGGPLIAAEPPPAQLTSAERDLVLAYRDLPTDKQREFVAIVMKEADQWRNYTAEVLAKHGVKRVIDDVKVAKHLPPAPASGEDTCPGDLDPPPGTHHSALE